MTNLSVCLPSGEWNTRKLSSGVGGSIVHPASPGPCLSVDVDASFLSSDLFINSSRDFTALSLASSKGLNADHVVHFAGAAQTAIVVERSLHADYFSRFGISPADFAATEPTPACEHYVSYLLSVAALRSFEVTLAALLPCFWIYREVGKHILAHAAAPNPYQAWIDTYAGVEFDKAVDAVIAVTDAVAANASPTGLAAMHHAFSRATQLEWMFWDSAYQLRSWPV